MAWWTWYTRSSGNLSSDLIGIAGAEQSLMVSLLLLAKLLPKTKMLSTTGSFKYVSNISMILQHPDCSVSFYEDAYPVTSKLANINQLLFPAEIKEPQSTGEGSNRCGLSNLGKKKLFLEFLKLQATDVV